MYLKLPIDHANKLLNMLGECPAKLVFEGIALIKGLQIFTDENPNSEPGSETPHVEAPKAE